MKLNGKMLSVVSVALGISTILAAPVRADVSEAVDTINVDLTFCGGCPDADRIVPFRENVPVSWQVVAHQCDQVGSACTVTQARTDTTINVSFNPQTKYVGNVVITATAPGTIPTCQGSTPPSCPAIGPYTYSYNASFVGTISYANCWCI